MLASPQGWLGRPVTSLPRFSFLSGPDARCLPRLLGRLFLTSLRGLTTSPSLHFPPECGCYWPRGILLWPSAKLDLLSFHCLPPFLGLVTMARGFPCFPPTSSTSKGLGPSLARPWMAQIEELRPELLVSLWLRPRTSFPHPTSYLMASLVSSFSPPPSPQSRPTTCPSPSPSHHKTIPHSPHGLLRAQI